MPFILFLAIITLFIKYYAIPENAYNIIVGLSLVIILNIWITKIIDIKINTYKSKIYHAT